MDECILQDVITSCSRIYILLLRVQVIVLGGPDVNRFAMMTQLASPILWEGTGGGGRYSVYRVASHRYGAEGLGWLSLAPLKSANASAPPRLLLFVVVRSNVSVPFSGWNCENLSHAKD